MPNNKKILLYIVFFIAELSYSQVQERAGIGVDLQFTDDVNVDNRHAMNGVSLSYIEEEQIYPIITFGKVYSIGIGSYSKHSNSIKTYDGDYVYLQSIYNFGFGQRGFMLSGSPVSLVRVGAGAYLLLGNGKFLSGTSSFQAQTGVVANAEFGLLNFQTLSLNLGFYGKYALTSFHDGYNKWYGGYISCDIPLSGAHQSHRGKP